MDLKSNRGGTNAAAMQAAADAKAAADAAKAAADAASTRAGNAMARANAAQTKTAAETAEAAQDAKLQAAMELAEQANTKAMTPGPKGDTGAASTVAGPKGDTGPSGQVITAVGHTVTGPLLLGANTTYAVTLSRPMPDSNYLVDFIRTSGLAVGKAALEVTARTTTTCTVKVTATLALVAADLNIITHY
jgi:hypothetical protein